MTGLRIVPPPSGVVVTHPVHQHAYETAVAAQEAGLLREFVTAFYVRTVPRPDMLRRYFGRRHHPDLDGDLVTTMPWRQLTALFGRQPAVGRTLDSLLGSGWFERGFDRAVATRLRGTAPPPAIVHAFEGAALETLKAARRGGGIAVLDVPSAHEQLRAALADEGARTGHFDTRRIRDERDAADFLIVPSDVVERCLVDNGVDSESIVSIPLGVDVERFSPAPAGRDGAFRFLYVGTIAPHKGIRYLLDAWRANRPPDSELVLVGPLGRGGKQLLHDLAPGCRWAGQVGKHEVDRWFRDADAVVLPSLSDAWGLVVAEALACALPVITTDRCGFRIVDNVHGHVVPAGDSAALADALRALGDSRDRAAAMGREGRNFVVANYTWSHYRLRTRAAYHAMLRGSDVRAAVQSATASATARLDDVRG